jgi:hypothetical protein
LSQIIRRFGGITATYPYKGKSPEPGADAVLVFKNNQLKQKVAMGLT